MRKLVLLLIIALLTAVGAVSAQENETYTVQAGDTLTSIANAFDVDADAILLANNLIDPNSLRVGQVLTIPTVALTVPRTHTVGAGETLNDIAIRYNTTVEALIDTNTIAQPSNLTIGQVLTLPAQGGPATFPRNYRLDIGDTLRSVGEQFGVTWQQIAAFNNIVNPNYVQAGTVIIIPPADFVVPTQPAIGGPVVVVPSTQVATLPTLVNGVYTVRAGDTMFSIASAFGVNVYDIAERNGILNLNSIFVGQGLVIR
ncbi:MAG: LysM peptidoglycan-binding domain-containing protein [Chloroflexota bacterium]